MKVLEARGSHDSHPQVIWVTDNDRRNLYIPVVFVTRCSLVKLP